MKIVYISDDMDERSQPNLSSLVFAGHTYAAVITHDQLHCDYQNYFPERAMSYWLDIPDGSICQVSREKGIDDNPLRLECDVYDTNFQPSTYFGLASSNRQGDIFNGHCLLVEAVDPGGDIYSEEAVTNVYKDFNEECIAQFEGYLKRGVCSGEYYITSTFEKSLLSIDKSFNLVWVKKIINESSSGQVKSTLYSYKNTAVFCLGTLPNTDIKSQILSLDSATGETVWQADLPFYVNYCILIGDRVYLSSKDDWCWCVLSADTGEILLQDKLTPTEKSKNLGWLWADSGYLFLHYRYDIFRIMDEATGDILQDITLPDDFGLSHFNIYPEVKNDHIYIRLGSAGGGWAKFSTYGGVMILSRDELKQGPPWNIDVEDKGDISHQAIVDGKTEYYEIHASYEELGDVLRFSQIEIKLVAQRYAYNHWGNLDDNWRTRINKKFNGRIVLCIDKEKLKNPDESKFDLMVELFNKHFEEKFRAPANKKALTLEWQYF